MGLEDALKPLRLPALIRYFYSGCLLLGLLQLTESAEKVNADLATLGSLLAALLILFAGVFIWTFYHQVVGEFIIFPLVHWLHERVAPDTCDMKLLRECGVAPRNTRSAYSVMREAFFTGHVQAWVELQHAHHQLLDITWLEILGVTFFSRLVNHTLPAGWPILLAVAVSSAVASVVADIRQHSVERLLMTRDGKETLRIWLVHNGFVGASEDGGSPDSAERPVSTSDRGAHAAAARVGK